jgi:DNA-binding NarL/FixJ family response regulator
MPGNNGLHAARGIRASVPATAVIALTRYGDAAYVQELMAVGAVGYVLKQSPSVELLQAIRAAAQGKRHLDKSLARSGAAAQAPGKGRLPITDRERAVLKRMALGHSNKEIAQALDVSVKTVEVHKANAMRKLQLAGRIDVIRFASLQGWLTDP